MQGLGRGVDGEVLEGSDPGRAPSAGRGPGGAEEVVGEGLAEHEVLHLGLRLEAVGVGRGHLKPRADMKECFKIKSLQAHTYYQS